MILEALDRFKPAEPKTLPLDSYTLLDLPDHLRRTVRAVGELGSASAEHVATQTDRARGRIRDSEEFLSATTNSLERCVRK